MAKHAFLSASSSHRWLACPPSAKLCSEQEDRASPYAQEGTDAHSLCQYKVEKALGKNVEDPTPSLDFYSEEMESCAEGYLAFVMEQVSAAKEFCPDPAVLIEQRLDFSKWVEKGFGTGDCVIIADSLLQIIDYKHGLGVLVSAEMNPQTFMPLIPTETKVLPADSTTFRRFLTVNLLEASQELRMTLPMTTMTIFCHK